MAKTSPGLALLEDACDRARLAHSTRAMFGGHGLFASNGGMFAGIVDDDRIVLKLGEEGPRGELVAQGGKPWVYRSKLGAMEMKEWILVPERFHDEPAALAEWARRAYAIAPAKGAKKRAKRAKEAPAKGSAKRGRLAK
jgi:TfoX/Sxy family transcriptional regulator of competence genes